MKKALAILLILMTTGSFVACGGAKESPIESNNDTKIELDSEGVKGETTEKIIDSVEALVASFEEYFKDKEIKKKDLCEGEIAKDDYFTVVIGEENGINKTAELFLIENNGFVSPRVDVSFPVVLADMKEGKITELNSGEFEKYNKIFGQDYKIDYAKVNEEMKKVYQDMTVDSFEVPYTVEMEDGFNIYFTFSQTKVTYSIQGATLVVQD